MLKYLGLWVLFTAAAASSAEQVREGDVAPNWMLSNLAGEQVSLYQEAAEGRTTVMIFWATWCRYCGELLPHLSDLQQSLSEAPVRLYALNIWEDGDPLDYMRKNELQLELLPDADTVATRFDIRSTPGVVVVGPDKHVLYVRRTGTNVEQSIAELKQALAAVATE